MSVRPNESFLFLTRVWVKPTISHLSRFQKSFGKWWKATSLSPFGGVRVENPLLSTKTSSNRKCWPGQDLCALFQPGAWGVSFNSSTSMHSSKFNRISKDWPNFLNSWQKKQQFLLTARYSSCCAHQPTDIPIRWGLAIYEMRMVVMSCGFNLLLSSVSGSFELVFLTSRNAHKMHFSYICLDWTCSMER